MQINFSKLTAAGNDFVLIDNRTNIISADKYQSLAKKLCDRKYSIGADGLIFLEKSDKSDFKMKYFNSDGSHAAMCGNGGRSIAKFAYCLGAAKEKMVFETDAGIINAEITGKDRVKLDLYDPCDLRTNLKIDADDKIFDADFINTGVPHAVIFVDDIEKIDAFKYGRIVRFHKAFVPSGANVNFVKVLDGKTILARTYERGVEGETLACGTGITASAIIAGVKGFAKPPVRVIARGGDELNVSYKYDGQTITNVVLEGPALITFEGKVEI
ncbi:MAG: diaminopimelate epimerase [Endomicrobium sp.]|jgi:diaminopimelate epimerase|nr:diaminopimelate epimerase [Endomicrobium sp.]